MIWDDGKYNLLLYTIISMIGRILPIILSYSQKYFINSVERKSIMIIVFFSLICYVFIKFLSSIYQYIDSYFAHVFILRNNFIFNKKLTMKLYKEQQSHFYEVEFNDKLKQIELGYTRIPFQFFSVNGILMLLIVFFFIQMPIIIKNSFYLLIPVVSAGIFSLFVSKTNAKKQYRIEIEITRDQRKSDYFRNIFVDKSSAKELRVFGLRDFFVSIWTTVYHELNQKREKLNIKLKKIQILDSSIVYILKNTSLLFLFYKLFKKECDFGSFVFLFNIVTLAIDLVRELVQEIFGGIYGNYLMIENFINYIELEEKEMNNSVLKDGQSSTIYLLKHEDNIVFREIELKNVSFKYPNNSRYAVKNISLCIKKGEIVSILGYNGSGKSTLSKLICGLLAPCSGKILMNDREINSMDREIISEFFGIAYQDFTRYLLTVRDNIGFGYIEKYNDININRALSYIDDNHLRVKLPRGLDTVLGKQFYSNGLDFSGGEWQKVALARLYMGDHEILILDEPTASIDPLSEMNMLAHFKKILNNRTAVLISHRIGFARLADRIVVLDNGSVFESGTHDELLSRNGLYCKMFQIQKNLYEGD